MNYSKSEIIGLQIKWLTSFLFIFITASTYQVTAQTTRNINLYLRSNIGSDTLWDGNVIPVFGITRLLSEMPRIPAKTIYCNEGDTVILNTMNISQNEHHTIHLHGLDVDTRNDGDPMTSFWLEHMEDTTYTFIAKHAGTYLYHCHVGDVVHVQMGMYGLIVVKAANETNAAFTGGPLYDKTYHWLLSEVDKSWHDTVPVHDPVADTIHLPPYLPDYFLVNGKSESQILTNDSIIISGAQNDNIYLRIASIGFYYNRVIFPSFLNAKVIDSDGRPLPQEIIKDALEIAPGERYGIMLYPQAQQNSTIEIQYVDMNTDSIWNSQFVPVNISGISGISDGVSENLPGIFPNPNNGRFNSSQKPGVTKIIVTNILGQDLLMMDVTQENLPGDASSVYDVGDKLEEGIYFFNFYSDVNLVKKEKIILIKQ